MKSKSIRALIILFLIGGLLLAVGCRREMSKAAYKERMDEILKGVAVKIKPNLAELNKLPLGKEKERGRLENQQIEILKDARDKIARITPPDDFFSGHSNILEFLDLFIGLKEKQAKLYHSATTAAQMEQRQELQENYQMMTSAFTRATGELTFLTTKMRLAFYDLLRYQSSSAF